MRPIFTKYIHPSEIINVKKFSIASFINGIFRILPYFVIGCALSYLILKHITYNNTGSEPIGYYLSYKPLKYNVGDLSMVCITNKVHTQIMHNLGLPYSQSCKNGMPFLLKRIVAKYPSEIIFDKNGITINGILQKNSIADNNIPHLDYGVVKLKPNQYFLMGETPHSYDSRYFGAVDQSQLIYKAKLLFQTQ